MFIITWYFYFINRIVILTLSVLLYLLTQSIRLIQLRQFVNEDKVEIIESSDDSSSEETFYNIKESFKK